MRNIFNSSVEIGGKVVGPDSKPYLVAEMSGNHNHSLERALEIVNSAADSGADAIKIQTFKPESMTIDVKSKLFTITDHKSPWFGRSLFDLYSEAATPWEWHKPIFDLAKKRGICCFSTPFDESAVDFLEELGAPAYKVASFENNDLPLIRYIAETGKPMIVSTGMATLGEIEEFLNVIAHTGNKNVILLKCTSTYPATPENSNIKTIPTMQSLFKCPIGLSDHSLGNAVAISSVALGGCLVEKHFTLSRSDGGIDSTFSCEPHELLSLKNSLRDAYDALGSVMFGGTVDEEKSKLFRRSIFVTNDIEQGGEFNNKNTKVIRPGHGLAPRYYTSIIGKKAKNSIARGTPLSWDDVL